jgi:hypothetical protein
VGVGLGVGSNQGLIVVERDVWVSGVKPTQQGALGCFLDTIPCRNASIDKPHSLAGRCM